MKQSQLAGIQRQIQLHNQLKKWFSLSFILTSSLAMLVYILPVFWIKAAAGTFLLVSAVIMLIIGLGLWRSKKSILQQLS